MYEDASTKLIPYGLGALVLGCVGVAFGDFALQWQPAPKALPFRTPIAYICGAVLAIGGAAILVRGLRARAALALGVFFGVWTLLLHAPRVIAAPTTVIAWNAFAEIAALAAGGIVGWSVCTQCTSVTPIARRVFGACFAVFGIAHFAYADFTAGMVPSWMPARLFWAYATGLGHLAASVSLVSGWCMPLASTLLTAMLASFVVLLHAPRVIAAPDSHIEWVMLGVSMSLTGAAWVVRAAVAPSREPAQAGALAPS